MQHAVASPSPDAGPSTSRTLTLHATHRGVSHVLRFPNDAGVSSLRDALFEITSIPPENQKILIARARNVNLGGGGDGGRVEESTLEEAGLRDGMRLTILGSTAEDVKEVRRADRTKIVRERPLPPYMKGAKPRVTSRPEPSPFHRLVPHPLPTLPSPERALAFLQRLSTDWAILHVMRSHNYQVGELGELLPFENPEILGVNEDRGRRIRLRLRSDDLEGWRPYLNVRQVLLHELAHIEHGPHLNPFKMLNSRLNAEVAAYEEGERRGRTVGDGDVYVPPSPPAYAGAGLASPPSGFGRGEGYVLGGREGNTPLEGGEMGREAMRKRVLEATMRRLEKEEKDIEGSCGSA